MSKSLTIQIAGKDDRLPVESFIALVSKTVAVLGRLDAKVSMSGVQSAVWDVAQVTKRSPLTLTLTPGEFRQDEDTSDRVVHAFFNGLRALEQRPQKPAHFDDETLKDVQAILDLLNDGVENVRFSAPGEHDVSPTLHVAANIREILEPASKTLYEYGTIEGKLEVVSVHKGDTFFVWEAGTNRKVECKASGRHFEQAKDLLRKRVAVTGRIKYRRRTEPISIQVESIRLLRPSSQLPQPSSMERIEITGGMSSEEYVGNWRDDD